uniref:G_PROTEIN_RECEP_F1_2 domain-containing protein n=1 Tax=Panagrellus redivivus TaxID=6233 RepID=A0A7E4V5L2_PANRE
MDAFNNTVDTERAALSHQSDNVNLYISSICLAFVVFNIIVLVTKKKLRERSSMFIALCWTNLILLLGVLLEAINRRTMYDSMVQAGVKALVISRKCLSVWTILQVYSNFAMPLIILSMSFERFVAVRFPDIYHTSCNVLSLVTITASMIFPYFIMLIAGSGNNLLTIVCFPKASYGTGFDVFKYAFGVVTIWTALVLNVTTYMTVMSVHRFKGKINKMKCYTAFATGSTLLISIPNLLLIIDTIVKLPPVLTIPSSGLSCVNCALQFFINFHLNKGFRKRCLRILSFGKYPKLKIATVQVIVTRAQQRRHTQCTHF